MEDFKRAGDKCGFEDERLNKTGQKESFWCISLTLKKLFHLAEASKRAFNSSQSTSVAQRCVWDLGGSALFDGVYGDGSDPDP